MIIDPEVAAPLRKRLIELVNQNMQGLVTGPVGDIAHMERQRGIITGLGYALDLLESPTPTETLSAEETNEQYQS